MQLPLSVPPSDIFIPTLSLWQPWAASLVVSHQKYPGTAIKMWETRGWRLPPRLIGKRILIHAAQKNDKENKDFIEQIPFSFHKNQLQRALRYGAIIGSVIFDECMTSEGWMAKYVPDMEGSSRYADEEFFYGDYSDGRFAWGQRSGGHVWFPEHLPARGYQKIYNTPLSSIPSQYHILFK